MTEEIWLVKLGLKEYHSTLNIQQRLWKMRQDNLIPDVLVMVEHTHTITFGKSASPADLLATSEEIQRCGVVVCGVERGGEYTYHGPGQLVGYPIMRLEGRRRIIHNFVGNLEEVMIKTLNDMGIEAGRQTGYPGVWVGLRKIGSIGIAIRRWVTYHGFALNVNPDLSFFRFIRPCGFSWEVMTSMQQILARKVDTDEVTETLVCNFAELFEIRMIEKNYGDIA